MKLKNGLYWFTIFALCFIAYQQVQDNIRPNYDSENAIIIYLLGVAPNFFPAIGIPALFLILIPYFKSSNKRLSNKNHLSANLISLCGLVSWEFLQLFTLTGRFDWNDLLWTILGGLMFHFIWLITPLTFKN